MASVPSDFQDEDYDNDYEEDRALAHYEGRPIHAFSKTTCMERRDYVQKQSFVDNSGTLLTKLLVLLLRLCGLGKNVVYSIQFL